MRKNKRYSFSENDLALLNDLSLTPDIVSFMINKPKYVVEDYRHRIRFAENRKAASQRYRDKKKKENEEKFGKAHGCYDYWSEVEIQYLLNSTEPDEEIAKKLNRTTAAIQKKREREIKRRHHGS